MTGSGLPNGTMGRIAMDICRTSPNVIYAQIEVAPDKETGAALDQPAPAAPAAGRGGGGGGGQGGRGGRGGNQPPDPQSNGLWRSLDKGKTWTFMSNQNQRPMYFSQIRVDPNRPDTVYVGGVNPQKSTDGGKTFMPIRGMGHVDNHAIWIDPLSGTPSAGKTEAVESQHVFYGNDGGMDVSYDGGRDVGVDPHAVGRAVLPRVGRHAASLLGVHGPAGQRQLVRAELDAFGRHPPVELDQRRRRRRLPEPDRSRPTRTSSTPSRRTTACSAST